MDRGEARLKPPTAGSSEQPTPTPDQIVSGAAESCTDGQPVIDERQLIEAAQRDPAQFAAIYEDNFARIYGYIARRVRDRSVAEDLTSEVFHQALASLPRFEWRGVPFGAWLIRIAANAIADRSKRASREQEIVIASEAEIHRYPDCAAGIQDSLEEIEYRARLF